MATAARVRQAELAEVAVAEVGRADVFWMSCSEADIRKIHRLLTQSTKQMASASLREP